MDREARRKLWGLFAVATTAALFVRLFLIENYRIASDSMLPNLLTGDLVLVSKFDFSLSLPFSAYEVIRIRRPRASEIVALSLPGQLGTTFVKRVIATEGDRVEIKGGVLQINDQPVVYSETPQRPSPLALEKLGNGAEYEIQWNRDQAPDFGPVDIPPGHFFVLGDNRNNSVDSRTWGPIPYSFLKGKVRFIWLSVLGSQGIRGDRTARWVPSGT